MPALKTSHTLLWSEMSGQNLHSSSCGHGGLWPAPSENPFHTSGKQTQEQVFITNEDKSIKTLDNINIVISQKKATVFIQRVHIIHIHVFPADFWWAHTSPSLSQQHCNNNKPTANYEIPEVPLTSLRVWRWSRKHHSSCFQRKVSLRKVKDLSHDPTSTRSQNWALSAYQSSLHTGTWRIRWQTEFNNSAFLPPTSVPEKAIIVSVS